MIYRANTEQTEVRDIVSGRYRDVVDQYIDAKVTCSTIHALIKAVYDKMRHMGGMTPTWSFDPRQYTITLRQIG